jgi:hypothetical protein
VTESRPSTPFGADDPSGDPSSPEDAMRSEVNAYASAILVKLLGIVHNLPNRQRDDIQGIELEVREMLEFIDPPRAAELGATSPFVFTPESSTTPSSTASDETTSEMTARVDTLIDQLERTERQDSANAELLRDLRSAIYTLRDDMRAQHDATTEAIQSLTATTRSLHYTVTALSARSEQIADLTGVAEEQIRVGVWQYALIAGLSSGALVAAIVAFISLLD